MRLPSPIARRHSRIEIIPLIDIMFFLLAAFMMVSLNMSKLNVVRVEAPAAASGERDIKADVFNVAIDREGQVYLGETRMELQDLRSALSNRLERAGTNLPIFVTGDRRVSHGRILEVLREVRRSGIQRVSFSVAPE